MKSQILGRNGAKFELSSLLLRLISFRAAKILPVWLLLIAFLFPAYVSAAIISTVAGNGEGDASFTDVYNGALATAVAARQVQGLVTDADGNLYYNANTHVVKRDATTGLLTLIAGNGTFGFSGDGGPATSAALQGFGVSGLGFDHTGNLLIADSFNHRVRVIDGLGTILTLWGDPSVSGFVTDMEYDGGGTLFTVDNTNSQIWITPPGGPTFIFAGLSPASPGFSGDGGDATQAQLNSPSGLALDAAGNVYVSDTRNHVIRRIDRITRVITTFAGTPGVAGYAGDSLPATGAQLSQPRGIDFDSAGNLFIADNGNGRVRRVDAVTGIIATVAGSGAKDQYGRFISSGDGGEATSAGLRTATNVALDADDNLFISDYHRVRKVAYADTTPPVGTVSINNGADFSTSSVALALTCDDGAGSGCAKVQISKDGGAFGPLLPFEDSIPALFSSVEGLHTVTVRFEDADRNHSDASDTITVDLTDPALPTVTAPVSGAVFDVNSFTVAGTAEPFVTVLIKKDNSAGALLATTTADASGDWSAEVGPFADGGIVIEVITVDRAGNTFSVGTRVGTRVDTTPPEVPVITSPVDGTTTTDAALTLRGTYSRTGEIGTVINITLRDGDTVVGSSTFGSLNWSFALDSLSVGTHRFSVTATDDAGNVSAASDVVNVTIEGPDITQPVVTPPADLLAPTLNAYGSFHNQADIAAFLAGATAVDNLDGNLPVTHDMPSQIPMGVTTVTFSATDAAGNTGTATATITLTDQTAPVFITPPMDQAVAASDASGVSIGGVIGYFNNVFASDNVDSGKTILNGSITHDAPSHFPLGVTTITFTATDAAGNSTTATADVTVTFTDVTPPQLVNMHTTPVTAEATSASGRLLTATLNLSYIYAWDETDGRLPVTHDAPAMLPIGTTIITFSATDAGGNTVTATRSVTITPMGADTTPPVVTPPQSIILAAVNSSGTPRANASAFLDAASAMDDVDGALAVSHDAPDPLPLGITTVTFSATDSTGNTGTATAVVTVTDQAAPVVTPPAAATFEASDASGTSAANVAAFLNGATAADNLGGVVVTNDAPDPLPLGATTVTFSATDAVGNTGTASAVITVSDRTPPVINSPASLTLDAANAAGAPVTDASAFLNSATAMDSVSGVRVVTHNAPDPLPLGDTTVTFTARDAAGNTGTAAATVTVTDTTKPVISADVGLVLLGNAALGGLNATAAEIQNLLNGATAQDNVDGAVGVTDNAPALFLFGSTTFTFTAVDVAGNATNRTATVTVNDPDATGNDAPAASGTGLTVGQSNDIGLDPNATTTDTDGDGVDDNQEVGDPASPSDQDGDGVLDVFESGNSASDASHVNGLAAETGTVDLQSTGQNLSQVSSSATGEGAPSGVAFPFGVISYETTVPSAGASQTVRLTFSEPLPDDLVLYKVDLGGNYIEIPAAQWNQVDANSIDLTLSDGGPFDLDGIADGKIVDPLAPGSAPKSAVTSSGGGGSASPWLILLFLLAMVRRVRGFGIPARR
ncbi:MAG: hypothetical protein OI74_07280 [Gammaproteobacteria bacterium (ex Lamellibrachia satsuma)]|nr:MAG: HYR domain-containing protein [Gammaproteobacteria bacterium (ex Lamellibrachia satsuma)]RRS33644.1 MAG: hypothetical protein OI74_07280 [Gammaproteobacteria bacterium (ex Lamellibrachia satsuma)]RRS37095.1 MAG: hypothetical protein NV67_03190 [Gammaproteobacteria bacterium (ex Lamellibrachia satsuma)]